MTSLAAPRSALRTWLLAVRPATLPAAASGVVVGLGAALAVGAAFRPDTALGCLAVALLLQVLANLANDLSDFRRGADTPDRAGPTRVASAGLVTPRQLEVAIGLTIGAGRAWSALWLAWVGGPAIVALGVLAIVAALAYTGGPWPYGYRGLGEVFVFIFFGLVAVVGTAYLQALRFERALRRGGDPGGRPDHGDPRGQQPARHPDRRARRASGRWPWRWGGARRRWSTGSCSPLAFAVPVVLLVAGHGNRPAAAARARRRSSAPLLRTVRGFARAAAAQRRVLAGTARLALVFGALFAVALALPGWPS